MKKAIKITGITILSLIAIAFTIPYLFKGKIVAYVKKEVNKSLNAKVDFEDVDLSLFRNFPKLSVRLENPYVAGVNHFEGDTLLSATSIDAAVNLWSLFDAEHMKVYGVRLSAPRIHALINKEGKANWEITKEDSTSSATDSSNASPFGMKIDHYSISDGYILYKDESGNMSAELFDVDHEGSGDLSADIFTLATSTNIGAANFVYEGIPYLVSAKTVIGADIKINNSTGRYDFKTDDILVNDLKLSADGFFQLVNDSTYDMDIRFKTPSNEFKDILSLVPSIYKTDFDRLKTSGKASFSGFVKGVYDSQHMPAYKIDLNVRDGFFQYPDLPKPIKNIQLSMKVDNPDGIGDHLVVDIQKGHIEMDKEAFDLKLLFKNPETAQYIDALAKGSIDLSNLSQFVKLEKGTRLSGLVSADVFAKGALSALAQQEGSFSAGGFFDIQNLFYSSKDFPQPLQHGNLKIQLENKGGVADNTTIYIPAGHMELGADPFDFSLSLSKPVTAVAFSGKINGRFTLDHLKQFISLEEGTSLAGLLKADLQFSGTKAAIDSKQYDKINLSGLVNLDNLKYASKADPAGIRISTTELAFNPQNIKMNRFEADYKNTHLSANGMMDNLIGYALQNGTLTGNLNISADKVNLNDLMGTDTTAAATGGSSGPFAIPANIDFTLNAKAGQVKYDKVNYNNVRGTLLLKNETVQLQNVMTEALDGTIAFNGSYSTKENKKQPDISLAYDVKNVDVQKAFYAYNTIQKIMPAGQFLSGKLSSQLTMTGKLGGDMMPQLNSLTGNGSLLLLEGALKKFKPLETLANTLQVNELREITIKDIKNYIEFSNGKVLVKPFALKVKDIEMEIGGMHGLDQSLDYIIQMKLPRKYLGEKGNALISNLVSQAARKGVTIQPGETVNLNIKMGGSLTNPSIKTDLKEAAGDAAKELRQQAADFVKAKADTAKQVIKDSVTVIRKQLTADLKEEVKKQLFEQDTAKNNQGSSLEATKKKAETTIKNTFKGLIKGKKAAKDSAGN